MHTYIVILVDLWSIKALTVDPPIMTGAVFCVSQIHVNTRCTECACVIRARATAVTFLTIRSGITRLTIARDTAVTITARGVVHARVVYTFI